MGALDKGTDIIAHSVRDQDVDQRLITDAQDAGTSATSRR